jgi:large subunit ribosomal protein L29
MSTQAENRVRAQELRGHSDQELLRLKDSLREELFKFRLQRYTNQLENTMQIRKLRRDLARVETILSARRKGLEVQSEAVSTPPADEGSEGSPARKTRAAKPAKRSKKAAAEAAE